MPINLTGCKYYLWTRLLWRRYLNCLEPLPPLPDLKISEQSAVNAADILQVWINHALSIAHDIAIKRNFVLFVQITTGLWIISYSGSLFNFLTLIYIGVLLSLSVPLLYDKYHDQINDKL